MWYNSIYVLTVAFASHSALAFDSGWPLLAAGFTILAHLVLRDSMNQFQWFPFWGSYRKRVYWIFKNNAARWVPPVSIGYTYFDVHDESHDCQYFHGSGLMLRVSRWSVQVGFGRLLQTSPWSRLLDVPVVELGKGIHGAWEEEVSVTHDSNL
jgi:hypothetical protein